MNFQSFCLLLALAFFSSTLVSCSTLGTMGGSGASDTINDSSLYRSQDRRFRSGGN